MKKTLLIIFLLTFSLGQSQTPAAGPTSPPARNAWDVLSQYGSAYTNQPGVYFDSFGGSNIVGDVVLGDASVVKKYIAHSYSGIAPNGANNLNVSGMTHLHMDVWSPDFVSFKVKLEGTNGSNLELEVPFAKNQGSWNSYDLDLSTYAGVTLANLKWIVPVTFGPNNTTLYITNVYFYRPATTQPPTLGAFTVPAQLVGAAPFNLTAPTSNSAGSFSYTSSNTNVATISGSTVTIVGGGSSTITANQAADGSYGAGSTTANLTVSYPTPGPSPIPPARDPGNVVSMFTGSPSAYANPVGFNMVRASWSGAALSTIPNGDNTCLQVDNFGFLGYVTDAEPVRFSAVGMTKLHVDVYLNTPIANMFVFLLSNGDHIYNTGSLVAGWNSLDINLSSYPAADLNNIYGFKFEHNQGAARQIYLDNIYFYTGGSDPVITDFNVPAAVFGDAPFALTAPLSDSAGAFSYTSSNTSVATISGSTVTIVGVGSSTITANQAADGGFDAGSIMASLVVSAPPLAIAAPTPPTRNTWDVVSLYSNAYSNVPSATWVGASALTDELLEGNDTKKMSNFIVEFINFSATDVSEMTMLHMDIYALDVAGFNIWLLNNGDRRAQISTPINGWRSIDIPMSTYSNQGLNLTGLVQLKFESLSGAGRTAYVDNVYFYRPATLFPATVGTFTVPAKNVGDADFALTPPTSNNTSPFTYSSNNTAIATIVSGDQIQVGTGGTCTITASQVSDGTYGPTTRTATFVVSFPAPGPSPIPPVRLPSQVKSLYSAAYTTVSDFDMVRAFWTAGTTLTTVPNGTDSALRVDNLGYIGLIDTAERRLDISDMTTLHLDIYVDAPFANLFFWLLTDGDQRRDITNLVAGWNSITINLSEFAGANLTNVYGLKFEQNQPSPLRFYIDNVYFSDDTVFADVDGDGFGDLASTAVGEQAGYVTNSTDCDDTNNLVYPGAFETCYDGLDNDCDGIIDNNCTPIVSVVQTSQCGQTLATIDSYVYANVVAGAQGYRFKVTNVATQEVHSIDRFLRVFRMTQLPTYAFDTEYQVEVSIRINNVWQPFFGTPCNVFTPATTTQLSNCGATLTAMTNVIYANAVPFATGYQFRVTNALNALDTRTVNRNLREFRMNTLSGIQYNTAYNVEVAVRNTDGTYLPFGTTCTVTTPAFPSTFIQDSQCDNYVVPTNSTLIYAESFAGAEAYRFKFENEGLGYSQEVDRNLRTITLNNFTGLTAGATYSVKVALKINGVWGSFSGKSCSIIIPGGARMIEKDEIVAKGNFAVVAYPNPFATNFAINVQTASQELVQVKVYDMLGRMVELRESKASAMEIVQFGNNYPAGVYNVIVTQGEITETLRIIKR